MVMGHKNSEMTSRSV